MKEERAVRRFFALTIISAVLGTLLILIGATFKIMHWPGASIVLIAGIIFMLLFIFFYYQWQTKKHELKNLIAGNEQENNNGNTKKSVFHYLSCIGAAIVIFGALCKIMHWPGSSLLLFGGLILAAISFVLSEVLRKK